jgi:hypothetical protein
VNSKLKVGVHRYYVKDIQNNLGDPFLEMIDKEQEDKERKRREELKRRNQESYEKMKILHKLR